jgi:tungstate transport system permease protein
VNKHQMQDFLDAFVLACDLVFSGNKDLIEIVMLSLRVSLTAVAFAIIIGLPLGAALATLRFYGRSLVVVLLNALMGLPPVVVGLIVYLQLSRAGPMGSFGLLYTPTAMIVAQVILILPIIAALSRQIIEDLNTEYSEQFHSLSISKVKAIQALIWDGRYSLVTVALAGFGRAIAEVGAVIIVGGNIDHLTRVMTTAIALETSKGDLPLALALGVILLAIALAVNASVMSLRAAGGRYTNA